MRRSPHLYGAGSTESAAVDRSYAPGISSSSDPDYRFSLANERTFLAWIRTALALVAGGVAAAKALTSSTMSCAG
jgi:putative membrane protein